MLLVEGGLVVFVGFWPIVLVVGIVCFGGFNSSLCVLGFGLVTGLVWGLVSMYWCAAGFSWAGLLCFEGLV